MDATLSVDHKAKNCCVALKRQKSGRSDGRQFFFTHYFCHIKAYNEWSTAIYTTFFTEN